MHLEDISRYVDDREGIRDNQSAKSCLNNLVAFFATSVSPHWICVIKELNGISGVYSADYFSVSVSNWVEYKGVRETAEIQKGSTVKAMLMVHLIYTCVLALQLLQPWCCSWAGMILQLLICHERFYYHSCHLECLTQSDCSLLGQNI